MQFFSEADDPINIRYDSVFKAVFTKNTPKSQGALARGEPSPFGLG